MPLDKDLTEFTTTSPILASYNYTDIADGTGYIVFYPCYNITTGGAQTSFLSPILLYSGIIAQSISSNQDVDFDVTFITPKTIKGKVRINITIGGKGVGESVTLNAQILVRHWDGTTETPLANVTTNEVTALSATTNSSVMCVEMDVARTHFAAGETLRITVQTQKQSGTGYMGWGHDPRDRNDPGGNKIIEDGDTTQMAVHIPFLIPIQL